MAPKFPRETLLELLLNFTAGGAPAVDPESEISNLKSRILKQLRHTLDAMMYGGIRDQLGGGFHRYSTDAQWLVPHFEIMLYDNAMLAWVYAAENPYYAVTAKDGAFQITDVPPGSYTLVAWHELTGETEVPVTVKPKEAVDVKVQLQKK